MYPCYTTSPLSRCQWRSYNRVAKILELVYEIVFRFVFCSLLFVVARACRGGLLWSSCSVLTKFGFTDRDTSSVVKVGG